MIFLSNNCINLFPHAAYIYMQMIIVSKLRTCITYMYLFLSDEGPMFETLDYTIRIGSTPTFLYFDLYLYSAYAGHYVYMHIK